MADIRAEIAATDRKKNLALHAGRTPQILEADAENASLRIQLVKALQAEVEAQRPAWEPMRETVRTILERAEIEMLQATAAARGPLTRLEAAKVRAFEVTQLQKGVTAQIAGGPSYALIGMAKRILRDLEYTQGKDSPDITKLAEQVEQLRKDQEETQAKLLELSQS